MATSSILTIRYILLFNNNGPSESNWVLFFGKILSQKISLSYKENKEIDLANKAKCFTENNNQEV